MCGIAILLKEDASELQERIAAMVSAIEHRGPDDSGTEVLEEDGVALGACRLSIIDLAGGHQPMWDEARRHVVVFNGEIYNYAELQQELVALGHVFASDHSDTEVVVHGYEQWGVGLFPRLDGMFAFAIWDRQERRLVIARDRAGEKPLYIGSLRGGGYAIASEMKALLCNPDLDRTIDPMGLDQLLAFQFALTPRTMLRSIQKLPAGHYATIDGDGLMMKRYFSLRFDPQPMGWPELSEKLDAALDRAVSSRMVSDVPVGLFLSGGLDSSTVGYYMSRHASSIPAYTVSYDVPRVDESQYAQLTADRLGLRLHVERVEQANVPDIMVHFAKIIDEPMATDGTFTRYLAAKAASRDVKVVLGGEGSDELLMGYELYRHIKVCSLVDGLPRWLTALGARALWHTPQRVRRLTQYGVSLASRDMTYPERLLRTFSSFGPSSRRFLSAAVREKLEGDVTAGIDAKLFDLQPSSARASEQAIATYFATILPDSILPRLDQTSMANSLEVRSPFLDPRLIDFLGTVPDSMKLHGLTTGKYALRRLMRGRLPDELVVRPKLGFSMPTAEWLRGPLKPLLLDYLSPSRLAADGLFDPQAVQRLMQEHLEGTRAHAEALRTLLMFELWRESWLGA